jgi:3-methylfumaryl-CoA hydratase
MSYDLTALKNSTGSSSPVATEIATASPVAKLAATFGIPNPAKANGDALPPGWHDLYFGSLHGPDNMRPDGQALKSSWMPANPFPFIRIARDRTEFLGDVRVGDELKRGTRIKEVSIGGHDDAPVVYMLQRSETTGPRGLAVVDEREFVYFDKERPAPAAAPALPAPVWRRTLEPSPVLLFRYSALRFNSHRIHYDRKYAMEVEGASGLIVQSSLLSQLLLELCRNSLPQAKIARFTRANRAVVHDTGPITLCGAPSADGKSATVWVLDQAGAPAIHGEINFAG